MDRLNRGLLAGRISLAAALIVFCANGCRSTKSEVPPGKPYQTTGEAPPLGFSNEPHPNLGTGMASLYGNKGPGAMVQDGRGDASNPGGLMLGTPTQQGPATLGAPTENSYGPPGTSNGGGASPSSDPTLGSALLRTIPSASQMVAKDPEPLNPGQGGAGTGGNP